MQRSQDGKEFGSIKEQKSMWLSWGQDKKTVEQRPRRLKRLMVRARRPCRTKGDEFYSKCTGKSLGFEQVNEV